MKRIIFTCAGLAIVAAFCWTGFAMAANVRTGDAPHVMTNEVIDGTLYAAGNKLRVEGRVQGDFICAGQEVDISGVIEGDVLCAAQKITISGEVQGDVRVAAQKVRLEGVVSGSASLLGQHLDTTERSQVARDLSAVGQAVTLNGSVGRDASAMAETFSANAAVGRHLDARATEVTVGDKAAIAGDLTYSSSQQATIAASARITGKTQQLQPENSAMPQRSYASSILLAFVSFAVLGGAVLIGAPRVLRVTTQAITDSPLLTITSGVAGLVLPIFLAGALLLTAVGMPLGLVVLFGWLITLLLSLVVSGHALGQQIVKKMGWHVLLGQFLGLGVLFGAAFIPYIGPLALLVAVVWGIGGQWQALMTHRGLHKKQVKEKT